MQTDWSVELSCTVRIARLVCPFCTQAKPVPVKVGALVGIEAVGSRVGNVVGTLDVGVVVGDVVGLEVVGP